MDEAIEKEVNEIYEQALGTVSSLAAEGEDLYPFALTSVEAGEGHMIDTDPEMDPDDAVSSLYELMGKLKDEGGLIGFAVITDVTMTHCETGEEIEAVRVALEHRSGFSVGVVLPYEMDESGRQFEEPKRTEIEPEVFGGK